MNDPPNAADIRAEFEVREREAIEAQLSMIRGRIDGALKYRKRQFEIGGLLPEVVTRLKASGYEVEYRYSTDQRDESYWVVSW